MNKRLLVTSVLFLSAVVANPSNTAQSKVSKRASELFPSYVSRGEWQAFMKKKLPDNFCARTEYFGRCYSFTQKECISATQGMTLTCLNKAAVPQKIRVLTTGIQLGAHVGRCVGEKFAQQYASRKKDSDECKGDRQWR